MNQLVDARTVDRSWLLATANAIQSIIGIALLRPRPDNLGDLLSRAMQRLPAVGTPVQELIVRGFFLECALLLVEPRNDVLDRLITFVQLLHRRSSANTVFLETFGGVTSQSLHPDTDIAVLIKRTIDTHFASRLTIQRLAHTSGLSRRAANELFYRRFSVSIRKYLATVRLRHGLDLVASGVKVEAAALMVGFRSKKDFYRLVRSRTGHTPSHFRAVPD